MDGVQGFDKSTCRLPEIHSEIWEGWIFVNFDAGAAALGPRLAPLTQMLANYGMSDMVAMEPVVWDSAFNWKVLVDNFMEAYHHIGIHRDTLEPLFPGKRSRVPDNEGPYSVLVMPTADDEPAPSLLGDLPPPCLEDWQRSSLVAAVVFPFHLFSPSQHALIWYQLLPETVDRFTLRTYSCFPREVALNPELAEARAGFGEVLSMVHQQDIGACEAVSAGLQSAFFESGRLSPLERSIW